MSELLSLSGKRIVLTQARDFMGPALESFLRSLGAQLIADYDAPLSGDAAEKLAAASGAVDVLVLNLAIPAPTTRAVDVTDDEWRSAFAHLVDPLPRFIRAFVPNMIERRSGKIIVLGSASALRGMKRASTYSAARGAQLAYVQAIGVELAPHGIQVNAIAQNFVDNPTYFPQAIQQDPRFRERLAREVPLGRLVKAEEDAALVAYLCTAAADCFVGQVFPVSGGWATR
jgi:NAD(P)-dependent dehydrogenase (short-subunit alcohol dehydrogenase family)